MARIVLFSVLLGNGETSVAMKAITHGACDFLLKLIQIEEWRNIQQHVVRKLMTSEPGKGSECSASFEDGGERYKQGGGASITEIQNLSFVGCSGSSGCSFQASVMSSKTGLGSEDLNQTKRMCMTTYEYALSHVSPELGQSSQPGWLGSPQGLDPSEVKDGLNPNQVSSPTQPLLLQLSHWADEYIGVVAMALAV